MMQGKKEQPKSRDELMLELGGLALGRTASREKRAEFGDLLNEWFERRLEEREEQKKREELVNTPTRGEVFAAIQGVARGFAERFMSRDDVEKALKVFLNNLQEKNYITEQAARTIAREAVPATLRDLDKGGAQRTGNVLMLAAGANGEGEAEVIYQDSAYWGTFKSGVSGKGDKVLYKGLFLREYDEDGVLVAVGSEIDPSDYATQALYEAALTAAEHTLKPTWDWMRAGVDV